MLNPKRLAFDTYGRTTSYLFGKRIKKDINMKSETLRTIRSALHAYEKTLPQCPKRLSVRAPQTIARDLIAEASLALYDRDTKTLISCVTRLGDEKIYDMVFSLLRAPAT